MEKIMRDAKKTIQRLGRETNQKSKDEIVTEILQIRKYSHKKARVHFRLTNKNTGQTKEYWENIYYLDQYLITVNALLAFADFEQQANKIA